MFTLTADAGLFGLTGSPAALATAPGVMCEAGLFTLLGLAATRAQGSGVLGVGAFVLTGEPAALATATGVLFLPSYGLFSCDVRPATLSIGGHPVLGAVPGPFVLTGLPAVTAAGSAAFTANTGIFVLTGASASLAKERLGFWYGRTSFQEIWVPVPDTSAIWALMPKQVTAWQQMKSRAVHEATLLTTPDGKILVDDQGRPLTP